MLAPAIPFASSSTANPYKGGNVNRLNSSWVPNQWGGDDADHTDRDRITSRQQDLLRNDALQIAAQRTLIDHTIATGIQTLCDSSFGGQIDDAFCDESDDLFEYWAENEADVHGVLSWYDMQRQGGAGLFGDGETMLLRCFDNDRNRQSPLCYQVLEATQLDSSMDFPAGQNGNAIRHGIEVDRHDRAVAYWLFDTYPGDSHRPHSNESVRVKAERVIHVPLTGRPSQTRNVSMYASVMQSIRDIDGYLADELVAARLNAKYTMFHHTDARSSGMGVSTDADCNGTAKIKLGAGTQQRIGKDDKITFADPNRPNSNAKQFIELMVTQVAMGANLSRYRLSRDYSGTTYIAARAARLDDLKAFRPVQMAFARQFVRPVRREWTQVAAALGRFGSLSASEFSRDPQRYLKTEVQLPGSEQLDPEKETDSAIAGISAGLSTYRDEYGKKGKNWRKELRQRAKEEAFIADLGLVVNLDRPSTPKTDTPGNTPDNEIEDDNG